MKILLLLTIFTGTAAYGSHKEFLEKQLKELEIKHKYRELMSSLYCDSDYPHDYYGHISQDSVMVLFRESIDSLSAKMVNHMRKVQSDTQSKTALKVSKNTGKRQ